jgi:hypothetical protein
LEVHSEAFAGAEEFATPLTKEEVLDLPETSEVLDILLQFMWRQKLPDLQPLEIEVLAPLSEAVAKYQVFSAMQACEQEMRYE